MNFLNNLLKVLFIIGTVLLAAAPLIAEYFSYKKDVKEGISYKRFRIAVFAVVFVAAITAVMYICGDLLSRLNSVPLVARIRSWIALPSRYSYFADVFIAILLNFAIGLLFRILLKLVRVGLKRKELLVPKNKDGSFTLLQKAERAVIRFFNKEIWASAADVLRILASILSLAYAALFIIFQIPAIFGADWIPYGFISRIFMAGYRYPVITLIALWECCFFLNGVSHVNSECPELEKTGAPLKTDEDAMLERIDEEVRRQFGNYYACDVDLSELTLEKDTSSSHAKETMLIAKAVENDKRVPAGSSEIYLDCMDKLVGSRTSLLINGSMFSGFSAYFIRYISLILAKGDNIIFVCNTDAQIESTHEFLNESLSEISSLFCAGYGSDNVDFDDPIWKMIKITGKGDEVAEAAVDEKSILVTSLRYLSSSKFEADHERFLHLVDTVVFIDTLETLNRYNRQIAMLNTRLRHLSRTNARTARDGSINKGFKVRYMSHQVRYLCFDDSRSPGLDKVLKNLMSVEFESVDAMHFGRNALVRCYNYDGKPDESGRITSPQFIDSREALGPIMNMAILCLANGAQSVSVFADGDIPYENISESVAANMGRLSVTVDRNTIKLNDMHYDANRYSVILAMDHEENLPKALRKYISLAPEKKTLIIVFSKPYMLRDFYCSGIDKLWTNTQLARIPVEDGTKKDFAQKVLIRASSGGIANQEVFRMAERVISLSDAVEREDIYSVLYSIIDTYDLVDDESCTLNDDEATHKRRMLVLNYFEFRHVCDFDENGQYSSEDRIYLRERGKLYDIINGRDMAILAVDESEYVLSLPSARITQSHIAGQNLIYNGSIYTIRRIDPAKGVLHARLAIGGHNTEAYRYIQDREYVLHTSSEHFVSINSKHIVLNRECEGVRIDDAYISAFRLPVEVLTHGYYEIDPRTLAPNAADSYYHRIDDTKNDEYYRQTYRRYGFIETPRIDSEGAVSGNKGALAMAIRFKGSFGSDSDKTVCLASAMLGELLRSMFPSVADCLAVCAVTKDSSYQQSFMGQARLVIDGANELFSDCGFELLIVEDSNTDLGVISALMSAGDNMLGTLFTPIDSYLKWYSGSEVKSKYLYYGADHEPECFDFDALSKLAGLLADNSHQLRFVDINKSVQREECDFCGKSFMKGKKLPLLPDGRRVCDECSRTLVGRKKAQLKKHIAAARRFLESYYGISLDEEVKFCFDSTERIMKAVKALPAGIRTGDIPLWAHLDFKKKRDRVEYGIPSDSLTELLVRELTHTWQLRNIPDVSDELAEGHLALVDIQYLRFLNRNALVDSRSNALQNAFTKAGVGYRELVERLKSKPGFRNNPFLYLLSVQTGGKPEDIIPPKPPQITAENDFGLPYKPEVFDRVLEGAPNHYYYSRLTAAQQLLYESLITAIDGHIPDIDAAGALSADVRIVSDALEYDHPELFWFRGCSLNGEGKINISYGADIAERERLQKLIDAAVPQYLAGISDDMCAYEAAVRIYTKVLASADYDSIALNKEKEAGGPDRSKIDYLRSICGVFINGTAVCEGYARAIAYLMQKCGIECSEAAGYVSKSSANDANGGAHAWNIIKIDGDYYYLDATWDDDSNTVQAVKRDSFGYDYFCITTDELIRTRNLDLCPVEPNAFNAVKANYYHHNGLVISKYDTAMIESFAVNAAKNNAASFAFKCSGMAVYRETVEKLFGAASDAGRIVKAASKENNKINASKYTYLCNQDLYTVKVRFHLK